MLEPTPRRPTSRALAVEVALIADRTVLRLKTLSAAHRRASPQAPAATRVLCTGPGEWLLVSQEYSAANLRARIDADVVRQGLVIVDLSEGLAVFEVRHAAARELLSKGCGLDLHPRGFAPGQCARTRFAQIPVVIECLEPSRFELYVPRSYADYLQAWLLDAAVEFGGVAA